MPLKDHAQTGDILFVYGKGFTSSLIRLFSLGKATHVGIVFDSERIYETDGAWLRSKVNDLSKYDQKNYRLFRIDGLTKSQKEKIKKVCIERSGTFYSYWDCAVQGVTFFLNQKMKDWIAAKLSNSLFTKCDEETRIVLMKALCPGFPGNLCQFISANIGGGNPEAFLQAIANRKGFSEVLTQI